MSQLECKDLALGYDGVSILENINFKVEKGDYLCIVGENGAGKSTLIKTVLGLQKPMGGEIIFDPSLKNTIGYLPQQTIVQKDFPASVKEVVISGCQVRDKRKLFYTKEDKALVKENIEKMGIKDLRNRSYRELSGGQQQRVLLARALCATKEILLLDEPVAGLDPMVTADMYSLIDGLNKEGVTIIMISHDIQAAMNYATHILHIGNKTFFGTKEEYKNSKIGKGFIMQYED
ncbi:MAG: metal ABC transporter ATP-binding protein [Lachnospiraceae bacterium]|nr:metal ABC transporter ATP-binding protein [Lachnospiraceae bacterium]